MVFCSGDSGRTVTAGLHARVLKNVVSARPSTSSASTQNPSAQQIQSRRTKRDWHSLRFNWIEQAGNRREQGRVSADCDAKQNTATENK
jgi:hypothetical protein